MARTWAGAREFGEGCAPKRQGRGAADERDDAAGETSAPTAHAYHCDRCAVLADRCRLALIPEQCAAGTARCIVTLCRELVAAPDGASSISFVRDTSIFGQKARY